MKPTAIFGSYDEPQQRVGIGTSLQVGDTCVDVWIY